MRPPIDNPLEAAEHFVNADWYEENGNRNMALTERLLGLIKTQYKTVYFDHFSVTTNNNSGRHSINIGFYGGDE